MASELMDRVVWFIPVSYRDYNNMPASVWIRCQQLIPYLEQRNIRCAVNQSDDEAEIAVFVRWQDEQAYNLARRMKQKGKRIVFDLCVNYFDETGLFDGGYGTTAKQVSEARRMIEMADTVTCASAYIAERAREFHSWVEYLPDSIDHRHFCYRKPVRDFYRPRLRAIWSGTASKARELEPILPLLQRMGMELVIISDRDPGLKSSGWIWERNVQYHFVPWRYELFPTSILEGEVCVVHRKVNDPYNQGHSSFKIGVFMAQGVPAIASPVPSYQELLGNGTGGRLSSSMEDWEAAFNEVVNDRDILARWSHEACQTMEAYRTERIVEQYIRLFNQLS
ncbi:MAG: hypothetical protein JW883_03565 [Deltaproteobacteria bacterium]|nr:hypothetical protein [Deltaproteobacteria bacterium]